MEENRKSSSPPPPVLPHETRAPGWLRPTAWRCCSTRVQHLRRHYPDRIVDRPFRPRNQKLSDFKLVLVPSREFGNVPRADRALAEAISPKPSPWKRSSNPTSPTLVTPTCSGCSINGIRSERDQSHGLGNLKAASAPSPTAPTLAQTVKRIETLASQNAQAESLLLEQKHQGARLKGRIAEQGRGLQVLVFRLAQVTARQTQRVRLPQERATTKGHLYLIVRHGRVYPLYSFVDGIPRAQHHHAPVDQSLSSPVGLNP